MKETIDIKTVFIPSKDGDTGMPGPCIKGFMDITQQTVIIDKKEYLKYEYVPDFVKLCGNENAKRIGDKIQML